MDEHDENSMETATQGQEKRADTRRSKTIRFSDPEWESIERAAKERGIPAAEHVRTAAVDAAEGRTASLDAEMLETIRLIYRMTYFVSTLKRDRMLSEGRDDELDTLIQAARESQADLIGKTSRSGK